MGRRERWCHGVEAGGERVPMFKLHEVKDVATACDEEQLHDGVVQRHITEEEIKVAGDEDHDVESLRAERDACR